MIPGVSLGAELGRGAAGVVYAGTLDDHRPVAVKLVAAGPAHVQLVERTLQEGAFVWSLNHPHVVRVLDFGMAGAQAYIVMERLRGETLHARLVRGGAMTRAQTLAVARQIAFGLAAIHARRAVHRDLKSDNVFLCNDGAIPDHVKLLDLGIARLADADAARGVHTAQGFVFGTLGYMAPEQVRGERVDARADLFALGAVLLECLGGPLPYLAATVRESLLAAATADVPPHIPPFIDPDVADLLRSLLDPDPARRPDGAVAVLERIDRLRGARASGFGSTTVALGGETVAVGDLHLPTLGDLLDHRRFRERLVFAIARLFRPGHIPADISALMSAANELSARQDGMGQRSASARALADACACDLGERAQRLRAARDALAAQSEARQRSALNLTLALMRLADELGDLDRAYVERYREIERTQAEAAAQANERGDALDLDGLYGQHARALLAELESLERQRGAVLARQHEVRTALAASEADVADRQQQRIELERSLLLVEAERRTHLFALESRARDAEDDEARLERAIEHHYLRLGVALQASLAAE